MGLLALGRIGPAVVIAVGVVAIAFGGVLNNRDDEALLFNIDNVDGPPAGWTGLPPPRVDAREFAHMQGGLFGEGEAVDVSVMDTSLWLTYDNPKFGYSFKYPPDWTIQYDNDNTASMQTMGRWSHPLQAVQLLAPGGRCPSHECNAIQPDGLSFLAQVSDVRCDPGFMPLLHDLVGLAGLKTERCLFAYFADPDSRMLSLAMDYPYSDADSTFTLGFTLEHGSAATTADRALLGAILATLALSDETFDVDP
jgi:hypothetical protein